MNPDHYSSSSLILSARTPGVMDCLLLLRLHGGVEVMFAVATIPGTSMVSGAVLAFTVAHESACVAEDEARCSDKTVV